MDQDQEDQDMTEKEKKMKMAVMVGSFNHARMLKQRILRVYIAGHPLKTATERDYLIKIVYPDLRIFCSQRGIELELVDLRWDTTSNLIVDHEEEEICLTEMNRCVKESLPGPCFIFLSTSQRNAKNLPTKLNGELFRYILKNMEDISFKETLQRFYELDENAVPSIYKLCSYSKAAEDRGLVEYSKEQWDKDANQLLLFMQDLKFAKNTGTLCDRSFLDKEMSQFLELQESEHFSGVFVETESVFREDEKTVAKNTLESEQNLQPVALQDLKSTRIGLEILPTIPSTDDVNNKISHSIFLQNLGDRLKQCMETQIENMLRTLPEIDDLTTEVASHLLSVAYRAESFFGRGKLLHRAFNYFKKKEKNRSLLVIYGPSGSGKASFLSKLAVIASDYIKESRGNPPILIYRFCGTTPQSSSSYLIMRSICQQLVYASSKNFRRPALKFEEMADTFLQCLSLGTYEQPILLFLDSLDQLNNDDKSHADLKWLPDILPPNVYLVVSTQQNQCGCFESLQRRSVPDENFLDLEQFSEEDSLIVWGSLLESSDRILTPQQLSYMLGVIQNHSEEKPTVFRVLLLFDVARTYRSTSFVCKLPTTVSGLIDYFFVSLEEKYGENLVAAVLGLISSVKYGLCENDLLDLLTTFNDVINHMQENWCYPLKKVSQMVFAKLKKDLEKYIISTRIYGKLLWSFRHRKVKERAKNRYLGARSKAYADILVSYFTGETALLSKDTNAKISSQPLFWLNEVNKDYYFNMQKINELPMLMLQSSNPSRVEELLCNFQFISAKIRSGYGRELLLEYRKAIPIVSSHRLKEFNIFVTSEIYSLETHNHLIMQQAVNMPNSNGVGKEAELMLRDMKAPFPWERQVSKAVVKYINKAIGREPYMVTLEGRSKTLRMIKFLNDQYIACLCSDNKVNIWNNETGENMKSISIPVYVDSFDTLLCPISDHLKKEGKTLSGVLEADIACACQNGDVYLWRVTIRNVVSAVLLSRWNAHRENIESVPISLCFAGGDTNLLATGVITTNGESEIRFWNISEIQPSRYQHPECILYKSLNNLLDGYRKSSIVSLCFVLQSRYVVMGVIDPKWNLNICICSATSIEIQSTIKYFEYAIPTVSVHEVSTTEAYLLISLLDGSGSISAVGLARINTEDNGKISVLMFQIPCRASCAFLNKWNNIIALTKERISLFNVENFDKDNLKEPKKHNVEWCMCPLLGLSELSSLVLPFPNVSTNETELPIPGYSFVSRWDLWPTTNTAAIGSENDVIKLIDLSQLFKYGPYPTHESKVSLCLKIPETIYTITCSEGPYPSTKVWDSETGLLMKSFVNEGLLYAAYSGDLSKVLYIHSKGAKKVLSKEYNTLFVAKAETFSVSVRNYGFPDSECEFEIDIPSGNVEEALFSNDSQYILLHYCNGGDIYVVSLNRERYTMIPINTNRREKLMQDFVCQSFYKPAFFVDDSSCLLVWNTSNSYKKKLSEISCSKWKVEGGCFIKGLFPKNNCWAASLYQTLNLFIAGITGRRAMLSSSLMNVESSLRITGSCILPNSYFVVITTSNGYLQLRDFNTLKVKHETTTFESKLLAAKVSPDGKYVVTCSLNGWVGIWDARTLEELGVFSNNIAITSFDVFLGKSGKLLINIGDAAGQYKVLEIDWLEM